MTHPPAHTCTDPRLLACRYVQHPVAVKALGGEKPEQPLPMYLTKKERKRIRKTTREEREREKRDKMMMGT